MTETVYRGIPLTHGCDLGRLPQELAERFVPVPPDERTRAWIDHAIAHPHGQLKTKLHRLALRVMSEYDANAHFQMHDMRLLGTAQWERLLGGQPGGRLLDIGAGDGSVTDELAPMFDEVVATETSAGMARRLRSRGYRCHEVDLARSPFPDSDALFDVVGLLNVLDRTPHPRKLLGAARARTIDEGALVVAMPLPYGPSVPGRRSEQPEDALPLAGEEWEQDVADLVERVLEPAELQVETLCRAPYLSRGDETHPVHVLDAAILVCRA